MRSASVERMGFDNHVRSAEAPSCQHSVAPSNPHKAPEDRRRRPPTSGKRSLRSPAVDVLVLGPLEVRRDGVPVAVRRGRPRRLLLALLVQQGGAVAPGTLIDQLWGDEQPVNVGNALQLLVSYLRRVLSGTAGSIERTAVGYRLVVPPEAVDAARFDRLVREAGAPVPAARRLALAGEALALWRGTPLAEAADDDFARADTTRLEELRLTCEELRFQALLDLGRHAEVLPDLGRAVAASPFRERLPVLLATALYRAGRQAEALTVVDRARRVLAEELARAPGRELRRLEEMVLRQAPGLAPPPATGVVAPPPAAGPAPPPPPEPVPAPLTALVGREDALAELREALRAGRLVTLTGPGGVGKSRLAVEAARGRDGELWWADLAGITDADQVARKVAAAAGLAGPSGPDPIDALRRAAGERELLLVLDTCEHVRAGAAGLVATLLPACPRLRVLATSRRALGLPGELVRPVPPLSLPGPEGGDPAGSAAVRLFCERAAGVRPGFALDRGNAADVARICRLLDGLPLALELAPATAAALSPAKIAALLADRLRLVGGDGAGADRHGGLRAAIGWSYELLSAEEAVFLDRLSVFAGAFPVEVAVEVAGAGPTRDGLELLLGLIGQSLVAVAGEDRFRLLETVRAYAAERLAARGPAELDATRNRHARWHLALAQDADRGIRGADQAGWLAELRQAGPDLRVALGSCLGPPAGDPATGAALVTALSWYWSFDGAFAEAGRWIEAALVAGPHDVRTTALLRLAAGTHAESLGRLAVAERECAKAAAVFATLGDARGEAESLVRIGTARWALGDLAGAAAAQEKALALFRSAGHDQGVAVTLVLRARTALESADPAQARRWLAAAGEVLPRVRDEHLTALALEQEARCALFEGDL